MTDLRRLVFTLLTSFSLIVVLLVREGTISSVKASPDIYQGDLVLQGNNVTMIEGRFDINGSIVVEENATLILRNAVLNFTQEKFYQHSMIFRNPINGHPRFVVENATITSNSSYMRNEFLGNSSALIDKLEILDPVLLWFGDCSVASLSNSSLETAITAYDNSTLSLLNCKLDHAYVTGQSTVDFSNSTINNVGLVTNSANYSITELEPCFVEYWNYKLNCSVEVAPDGWVPSFTLRNTHVGGWNFDTFGFSNVTISDSELVTLWTTDFVAISIDNSVISTGLWSYDFSNLNLYNTTTKGLHSYGDSKIWFTNSSSNIFDINHKSEVYVSWHLDVYVVDLTNQSVPSADVTVTYPNGTVAESKLADTNGWARLTLMEKMINATDKYSLENYTVKATYEYYSDYTKVNMTENKQITLTLEDTSPPVISILSPKGKAYSANEVSLTFTVGESTSWIGYSLDSQMNVTINHNTTVVGLADGLHTITVYANDTFGNMGYSHTVYFTVDTVSPNIDTISPANRTYTTSSVSLSLTVDEVTSWIGYCLDGQENVTITGNTTLSGLANRLHSLIIYANDTAGNAGFSEIVYFSVETPEPKPFPIWTVVVIVIIAGAGATLLIYFTKIKKPAAT